MVCAAPPPQKFTTSHCTDLPTGWKFQFPHLATGQALFIASPISTSLHPNQQDPNYAQAGNMTHEKYWPLQTHLKLQVATWHFWQTRHRQKSAGASKKAFPSMTQGLPFLLLFFLLLELQKQCLELLQPSCYHEAMIWERKTTLMVVEQRDKRTRVPDDIVEPLA